MDFIFNRPVSAYAKLVYAYLYACADDLGKVYVSKNIIAARCSMSVSSVRNTFRTLEAEGLLVQKLQISEHGDYDSNCIQLLGGELT